MSVRAAWVLVVLAACGARTGLDLSPAGNADGGVLACTSGPITLAAAQPAAMFVLDRSGSMDDVFSDGQSRWQVLTAGLAGTLPQVDSSLEIGALLFPSRGAGGSPHDPMTCSVPSTGDLGLATGHAGALVTLLQSTTPGGGTPTADAIDVAAGALLATRAATTARALVLATDGAPNCDTSLDPATCTCADTRGCGGQPGNCLDDTRTVSRIAGYAAQGVPTYVIGIASDGDSVFTDVLDAMAVAGGTPLSGSAHAYYAADSASDLDAALAAIRDQVGRCTYLTTSVPNAGGSITVSLGGVVLPDDPTGATGWTWTSESNGQIVLAAGPCAQATAAGAPAPVAYVECAEM
jgi:hypothetical protein